MNVTEETIAAALSGHFYRMAHDGEKSIVIEVTPPKPGVPEKGQPREMRPFTEEDADMMVKLRGSGLPWDEVALTMGRSTRTLLRHYSRACAARGVSPTAPPSRLTRKIIDAAVVLLKMNCTRDEVMESLKLTANQFKNIRRTFRRQTFGRTD